MNESRESQSGGPGGLGSPGGPGGPRGGGGPGGGMVVLERPARWEDVFGPVGLLETPEDGLLDPDDPQDAQVLATQLRAGGSIADALLRDLGWDEPVQGFDPADVLTPIGDLSDDGLFEELQTTHRAIASTQGRLFLLISELAHRRAAHAVTELTGRHAHGPQALSIAARALTEEVALELCLSKSEAGNLTDTALGLCTQTPDTLDALLQGDLDLGRAETILRLTQSLIAAQHDTNPDLDPDQRTDPDQLGKDLETELLKKAAQQTKTALKRTGEKAQIQANPNAAEYRHRVKRTRRHFAYLPDTDSMCRLSAYLPADQGITAKNAMSNQVPSHHGL